MADALSQRAELQPPDSEDDKLLCLIPETKFTKIAACEVELTDSDWQELSDIILVVLMISNVHILSDICRLSQDWVDRPEGLMDWVRRMVGYGFRKMMVFGIRLWDSIMTHWSLDT